MQLEYISGFQVFIGVLIRFWPVWLALIVVMSASFMYKKQLGLYGQLYDSYVGMVGLGLCLFWLFTALFSSTIAPFDPIGQIAIMKDALVGAVEPASKQ